MSWRANWGSIRSGCGEINGAKDGIRATHGVTWNNIGYQKTLEAARASEHMKVALKPNQGRGIASGYWHNAGGESSAAVHVNEDGTVTVTEGHPDIGGSRASMAMMVAEVLSIPLRSRPGLWSATRPRSASAPRPAAAALPSLAGWR